MAKIYTRTGDKGYTGLVGGSRLPKTDPLFEAIGDGDELSAVLGTVYSMISCSTGHFMYKTLVRLQDELFTIGAILAGSDLATPTPWWMEELIDHMTAELEPLRNFIHPGGCVSAAHLHLARTICRRYERHLIPIMYPPYSKGQGAIVWANRASDLLFTMARWMNATTGQKEEIWKAPA